MVSLMQRRREMMGKKEEPAIVPVYSLENHRTTAGELIDTGVYVLNENVSMTILFDYTYDAVPAAGQVGCIFRPFTVYNSNTSAAALWVGIYSRYDANYQCHWQGTRQALTGNNTTITKGGRQRIVVTHEANSNTVYVYARKDTGTRVNASYTQTYTPTADDQLTFAAGENNNYSFPAGMLTTAKVYDVVLPASQIDAFLA